MRNNSLRAPARYAIFYALFAALWIFLSDAVLGAMVSDPINLSRLQTFKGWLFIAITTILLFYLLHRFQRALLLTRDELLQVESKFYTLFNNLTDLVLLYELLPYQTPGRFIEVNQAACERLGIPRQKLLGMSRVDITPKDQFDSLVRILHENEHHEILKYETYLMTRTGERLSVEVRGRRITWEGKPAILAVAREVIQPNIAPP